MQNKENSKEFISQFQNNQGIVHKICNIYSNSKEEHEDLFQEISIQAWKGFKGFKGNSKFSTWLYRVSLNTAITFLKKGKKRVPTADYSSYDFKIASEEYDRTEEEQLSRLYTALEKLNNIEKALVLLYLENKNYDEISDILGITSVNARVKMNRTKQKLKKILNP